MAERLAKRQQQQLSSITPDKARLALRSPNFFARSAKKQLSKFLVVFLFIALATSAYANTGDQKSVKSGFFAPLKNALAFKKNQKNTTLLATVATTQTPDIVQNLPTTLAPSQLDENDTPSLLALLQAEFALDRDDPQHALALYKNEANKQNATAVFERALGLSLQFDEPSQSLAFAKTWQDNNQDHVPVWFYVTHLALKAGDYDTAANNLNLILEYDPNADLRRIFEGILPTDKVAQSELAYALQAVNNDKNPSLSALKAALLTQLGEHDIALLWAEQAILAQPKNLAFLTLKADMLQGTRQFDKLQRFLDNAIKNTAGDTQKQLYLYQIRHLIDHQKLSSAWQVLRKAHTKFANDHEIALLASLVGLDIKAYKEATKILTKLTKYDGYVDQAHYYLGIAFERQNQIERAIGHFLTVNDPEWLMDAQKKVLTHYLNKNQIDKAIELLVALRENHPSFASDSYALQAQILVGLNQKDQAKTLLDEATSQYPDDSTLLFASSQLLDDEADYGQKLDNFIKLQQLEPFNPRFIFEQARLILLKNPLDNLALTEIIDVSRLNKDHPDYDESLHLDALAVLARNDLIRGNFNAVIERLSFVYAQKPNFVMGELLLRAYYGLGNHQKVNELLDDLTVRFGGADPKNQTNHHQTHSGAVSNATDDKEPQGDTNVPNTKLTADPNSNSMPAPPKIPTRSRRNQTIVAD